MLTVGSTMATEAHCTVTFTDTNENGGDDALPARNWKTTANVPDHPANVITGRRIKRDGWAFVNARPKCLGLSYYQGFRCQCRLGS